MTTNRRKPYPEVARERIEGAKLINKLADHAEGICEMSSTQIKAAEILLRKVVPDLKAVEHSGTLTTKYEALTDEELNGVIAERLRKASQDA